jgi:hypothetical protein
MNIEELRTLLFEYVVTQIMSNEIEEHELRDFLMLITAFNDSEIKFAYEVSQMLTQDTCEHATLLEEAFFYIINNYS